MSRKALGLVVGIAAFIAGSYAARTAIDFIRREPGVSSKLVQASWVQQAIGGTSFDVPWPLETQDLKLPDQVARLVQSGITLSHEADGLNVMAMHMAFVSGTPTSLDGAAEGAVNNLRTVPGTLSIAPEKHEMTLFNGSTRAIEIGARIERERGVPLQMRGVVFGNGPELYQILMICRADQTNGPGIWVRIRSSIQRRSS